MSIPGASANGLAAMVAAIDCRAFVDLLACLLAIRVQQTAAVSIRATVDLIARLEVGPVIAEPTRRRSMDVRFSH